MADGRRRCSGRGGQVGEMAMGLQEEVNPLEQGSLCDVYLPYLPEKGDPEGLDALLTDMLARTQAELDRLTPQRQP